MLMTISAKHLRIDSDAIVFRIPQNQIEPIIIDIVKTLSLYKSRVLSYTCISHNPSYNQLFKYGFQYPSC